MEENKVAQDWTKLPNCPCKMYRCNRIIGEPCPCPCHSSAPNSPEVTRLSGEQAEERTAREGRKDNMQNHWWTTREINGRWVSACACGATQDIHDMTEAEIKTASIAALGQCPITTPEAAEN